MFPGGASVTACRVLFPIGTMTSNSLWNAPYRIFSRTNKDAVKSAQWKCKNIMPLFSISLPVRTIISKKSCSTMHTVNLSLACVSACFVTATIFFLCGVGLIALTAITRMSAFCYVAAVFFGFGMAVPTVINPILAAGAFGRKDFTAIYGFTSAAFFIGPTICQPFTAFVYDLSGSYIGAFLAYFAIVIVVLLLGLWLLSGQTFSVRPEIVKKPA